MDPSRPSAHILPRPRPSQLDTLSAVLPQKLGCKSSTSCTALSSKNLLVCLFPLGSREAGAVSYSRSPGPIIALDLINI